MQLISSELYREVNPNKKDAKWCNLCVTQLRMNWLPLVNVERMAENKRIIFGEQSMDKIKSMFKDKEFLKCTEFIPLGIWTKIVNTLVEEFTKIPPKIELKANDATAISDKKADILLLQSMGKHQQLVNSIKEKVGDKIPFTVGNDKFKTNIEEFQRLGLDPQDPEDVEFYLRGDYPKLKYEIAGQKLINIAMKLGRFDEEMIRSFVYDLLAANVNCMQTYVNAMTGEIKYDYIYPEQAYGIFSDDRDGSNDICKGVVKNLTVEQWLSRVGNEFDFKRDWTQLLWALNYTNGTRFTGFIRNGVTYDMGLTPTLGIAAGLNDTPRNSLDWTLAYTYKIYVGYIEFLTIDATATYLAKIGTGEVIPKPIDFDYFMNKEQISEYYKESYYNEQQYKSYFLVTSSTSQWIYDWGKVYYQQLEGAFDQYSRGTLHFYRLEGVSAADISKYYIDLANLAAYRLKWLVYKAKPTEDEIIIPELIKVSKAFQKAFPQNNSNKNTNVVTQEILNQLIQYRRENMVILRDYPEIDGKTTQNLHPLHSQPKQADPIALWMQTIEGWCEQQIAEKIGLNDLRLGQIQNARQGLKQGEQETNASYNSTGYLFRTMGFVKERAATTTLLYTQDIIRFEDSLPYNWIKKILGYNEFENLKLLKDYASHRYSIIFQSIDDQTGRRMLLQQAGEAMEKGQITPIEWGILFADPDYRSGLSLLNAYRYKAEKKARQIQLQDKQVDQQNAIALEKQREQTEKTKGDLAIQKSKIDVAGEIEVAKIQTGSKEKVKEMGINAEPAKQTTRVEGQKEIISHKANTEAEKALQQ